MQFLPGIPIYKQIIQILKEQIFAGAFSPGEKIPSVRDLSYTFSVNANTMQRALCELEREGLVYSERTTGRFVTKDVAVVAQSRKAQADELVSELFVRLKALGYSKDEMMEISNRVFEKGE